MGLWNSVPGTLAVELPMLAAGIWLYTRVTSPKDRVGRWALAALVAFFLLVYAGAAFGPPPPSMTAVAVTCLTLAVLVPWAVWIDRHRRAEDDAD